VNVTQAITKRKTQTMITSTRALCSEHAQPLFYAAGDVFCEQEDCSTSWSDLTPQHDERVSTREGDEIFAAEVWIQHEDGAYGGVGFVVERTGGNCTALVHETDDGGHVVLTSGDASHDVSGPVLAAAYAPGAWHNGGDPVWTAEGDDADGLARQALASL
jgi:hypothetical protein